MQASKGSKGHFFRHASTIFAESADEPQRSSEMV